MMTRRMKRIPLVVVVGSIGLWMVSCCHGLLLSPTPSTTRRIATTSTSLSSSNNDVDNNDNYLNPLLKSIQPSKTVEIFSKVKELEATGVQVTSLCVGEPDFLPSQVVLDALVQAVRDGDTKYTAVTGTVPLRRAIAADLERRKGVKYNPLTEIVVGNGAKQCVYQGILATAGKGDAVIVPAPYWTSYPEMVLLAGAIPIIVKTDATNGFLMTPEQLRGALQEQAQRGRQVKLLILCNPSNPTGGVYSTEQLQAICDVLYDYPAVRVLADEIYERLVYPVGSECPSVAAMPNMWHRTLTVNGFSKAYAMTGLRLGYVAAPAVISRAIATLQSQFTSCAGSLSQAAGLAALQQVSEEELQYNVAVMQSKRDYVVSQLSTLPGVILPVPPQGAFYVLPDVTAYLNPATNYDDTQLCMDLLAEQRLALVPGSGFGAPGTVRISYATSLEELQIAMDKLRNFFLPRWEALMMMQQQQQEQDQQQQQQAEASPTTQQQPY